MSVHYHQAFPLECGNVIERGTAVCQNNNRGDITFQTMILYMDVSGRNGIT